MKSREAVRASLFFLQYNIWRYKIANITLGDKARGHIGIAYISDSSSERRISQDEEGNSDDENFMELVPDVPENTPLEELIGSTRGDQTFVQMMKTLWMTMMQRVMIRSLNMKITATLSSLKTYWQTSSSLGWPAVELDMCIINEVHDAAS